MNRVARFALVAGMAAVLTGCATAAQRQFLATVSNNRAAGQDYKACVAAIYDQPELAPLRRDLPSDVRNATLEQLANENYVSDDEIRLILANYPKLQLCRRQLVAQLSQTMPTIAPILVKTTTTEDNYLIALLQRRLRWGEFLQRAREAVNEGDAEAASEGQRVMAGLEQANEAELERRQAALAALAAAGQEFAARVRETSPVFTNCMRYGYQGNMVQCTTQ